MKTLAHPAIYTFGGGRADASVIPSASPLASPQTDVSLYYRKTRPGATNNVLAEDTIINLAPGSGYGEGGTVYPVEFGPELGIGRTLADALPGQNILLVKGTRGGSNLHSNWAVGGGDYTTFLDIAGDAIDAVIANGDNPVLMGMFWVQGESDTGNTTNASNYGANLTDLISRVRTDLFGGSEAPFVLSQLSDNQYNSLTAGLQLVRQGQSSVNANVANTAMVTTDDDLLYTVGAGADQIHFDTNGQINLGNALGAELVSLVPEPNSLALLALSGLMMIKRRRRDTY